MTSQEKISSAAGGAIISGSSGAYAASLLFNAASLSTAGVAFAAAGAVANFAVLGFCVYIAARAAADYSRSPKHQLDRDLAP